MPRKPKEGQASWLSPNLEPARPQKPAPASGVRNVAPPAPRALPTAPRRIPLPKPDTLYEPKRLIAGMRKHGITFSVEGGVLFTRGWSASKEHTLLRNAVRDQADAVAWEALCSA